MMLHTASKLAAPLAAPGFGRAALIFVLAFAASAAIGELLFRSVETPMIAALRRLFARRSRPAPSPRLSLLDRRISAGDAQEGTGRAVSRLGNGSDAIM
ncbi:hypothetical protein ACRBEV_27925 [Methylobacterium phyllosphaerae]